MIQVTNKRGGITEVLLPDSRFPTAGWEFTFDTAQIENLYKALGEKIADMDEYKLKVAMDNGLTADDMTNSN